MEMDPETAILATVQAQKGSRVHFSWGAGNELRLCEVAGPSSREIPQASASSSPTRDVQATTLRWYGRLPPLTGSLDDDDNARRQSLFFPY